MAEILIVDDDQSFSDYLVSSIAHLSHDVQVTHRLRDGLKLASSRAFDAVMLDVQLPDGNGIDSIGRFSESLGEPEIIIITGQGDPDGAETAIQCGAWDYIEKPATAGAISLTITRALEYRKAKEESVSKKLFLKREQIIGSSHKMKSCLNLIQQSSTNNVSVLIQGETGTGKELLARAIHENSNRAEKPFIVVDCAAIPESLVEGLLFGHERGAFSSADRKHIGLIEQANTGTLFLDEVGELPLSMQKAFLRVLQERRFRPLGASHEKQSDFRLVSATNRQMDEMVNNGLFREDLLYRISSFSIHVPPLREREGDVSELSIHHLNHKCYDAGLEMKGFSPDFFETLDKYSWPGNVRQLLHALDSALVEAGKDPLLYPKHLPVKIRASIARSSIGVEQNSNAKDQDLLYSEISDQIPLGSYKSFKLKLLESGEQSYFHKLANQYAGNVQGACDVSGLSRSRLYHFLKKYNISLREK